MLLVNFKDILGALFCEVFGFGFNFEAKRKRKKTFRESLFFIFLKIFRLSIGLYDDIVEIHFCTVALCKFW